ncbi:MULTISPECIES: hypothetical protein [Streptomyces]|uniref:Uncharacterized protein n=1 Tax=Streptomyces chengmaiensis TaxID=3040919 RepID=A0ABT6HJ39_9ACTN|nr:MULTISPECIES: hypothetical protein [Streptomyces]MDH2388330.1 hypothetical protein [Streptomyces chengmaiensis]WRQ82614.1 hypothetical protein I3F59_026485 [Streptomyces sp. MUM 178J]WRQ83168.1 hypothetical protein I3F59_029690 [Streptomyces sp. MUM 178J]
MGKPNTRRLDKEIRLTERKLEAVQNEEMWPLNSAERRKVVGALAGGSYRVVRGKSTGRAERTLENVWNAAQIRLTAELTALRTERQRIVNEHATAKAAKKSSGWW